MFEGLPTWPDASRIWQVVDRHKVDTLFTAPTALRALMKEGDDFVRKTDRSSLKVLGSVGEPINRRRGAGITTWSAKAVRRSSMPGGRPKRAES